MEMFVGIVVTLALLVLAIRVIMFFLRLARHAAQDVSQYARHQNPTVEQSRAQHREVATGKPQFTQAERDYMASHVPASARTSPRRKVR